MSILMVVRRVIFKLNRVFTQPLHEAFCRLYLESWGVQYGPGLRLYGKPLVSMEPGSKIFLGSRCRLRSNSSGNAIGINHEVVIRTITRCALITIGDDFGMSGGAICSIGLVKIGNRVMVGANCVISDSDLHPINKEKRAHGHQVENFKAVLIDDDVWIGANSYICKGVSIGKGAVVGACSVVTKDVLENSVVAGNPARVVKSLA